ncbi:MAG: carbohydrate porin [Phycisphaerae bacterium]|nr:carbohydrate porin [Phycisphaerae bacterium]
MIKTVPVLAAALAVGAVHAQDAVPDTGIPESLANSPTDDAVEMLAPFTNAGVPIDQPAALLGPREPGPSAPLPDDGPAGTEWFGGLSPWEWSRLTGDWGGARTWLEEHGVTFASSLTIEWGDAISGGTASKWVTRNYFNASLAFDTEKLVGFEGGQFYVEFATTNSPYGGTFVPVTQWSSTIELAESTTQVSNIWYEQRLFDDVLRLKFGKIDPTLEFGYLEATAGFVNLATLYPVSMVMVPTYSNSGLGGLAYLYPCEHFYIGVGAFDAGFEPDEFIRDDQFDDTFLIGETGITWDAIGSLHDGRVSFGGWWDSRELDRLDGNGTEPSSWGIYALAQQHVWRPEGAEGERGLWIFGQFGYADEDVIPPSMNIGGGVTLRGTFPTRDLDALGIYASHVQYADALALPGNETVVELFYGAQITPAVRLTPDIQFYFDPSGDDTVTDPIVFTLRLELDF